MLLSGFIGLSFIAARKPAPLLLANLAGSHSVRALGRGCNRRGLDDGNRRRRGNDAAQREPGLIE